MESKELNENEPEENKNIEFASISENIGFNLDDNYTITFPEVTFKLKPFENLYHCLFTEFMANKVTKEENTELFFLQRELDAFQKMFYCNCNDCKEFITYVS